MQQYTDKVLELKKKKVSLYEVKSEKESLYNEKILLLKEIAKIDKRNQDLSYYYIPKLEKEIKDLEVDISVIKLPLAVIKKGTVYYKHNPLLYILKITPKRIYVKDCNKREIFFDIETGMSRKSGIILDVEKTISSFKCTKQLT
jgi:hypothetical protein